MPTEFAAGETISDESIQIEWTPTSLVFSVLGIAGKDFELRFAQLHDEVRKVTHKRKDDQVVVTLWKVTEISWFKLTEK